MCSGEGDRTLLLPGFPIRKSSDHSSVDSSPRLIAASYVLHRLLVPRHPPCALNNLATKMLASTVQFSRYGRDQILVRRVPGSFSLAPVVRRSICPSSTRRRRCNVHRAPARRIRVKQAFPPDPSGPNSVPRQTVQSVSRSCCHDMVMHIVIAAVLARRPFGLPTGQCSTLEHHPRNIRPRHGSGRPAQNNLGRLTARCSLERR